MYGVSYRQAYMCTALADFVRSNKLSSTRRIYKESEAVRQRVEWAQLRARATEATDVWPIQDERSLAEGVTVHHHQVWYG